MHLNQLSCPGAWLKVEVSAIILFIYMICPGMALSFHKARGS